MHGIVMFHAFLRGILLAIFYDEYVFRSCLSFLGETPGTGKTMLMDMFYSHVDNGRKKRVHFNSFMLDIHKS